MHWILQWDWAAWELQADATPWNGRTRNGNGRDTHANDAPGRWPHDRQPPGVARQPALLLFSWCLCSWPEENTPLECTSGILFQKMPAWPANELRDFKFSQGANLCYGVSALSNLCRDRLTAVVKLLWKMMLSPWGQVCINTDSCKPTWALPAQGHP